MKSYQNYNLEIKETESNVIGKFSGPSSPSNKLINKKKSLNLCLTDCWKKMRDITWLLFENYTMWFYQKEWLKWGVNQITVLRQIVPSMVYLI